MVTGWSPILDRPIKSLEGLERRTGLRSAGHSSAMAARPISAFLGSAVASGRPPRRKAGPAQRVRRLILQVTKANPLWQAPRIHGELKVLGTVVPERTISRVLPTIAPSIGVSLSGLRISSTHESKRPSAGDHSKEPTRASVGLRRAARRSIIPEGLAEREAPVCNRSCNTSR